MNTINFLLGRVGLLIVVVLLAVVVAQNVGGILSLLLGVGLLLVIAKLAWPSPRRR